jgi:hypothetical protein
MFLFRLKVLSQQKRITPRKVKIMTTTTIMRKQAAPDLQLQLETLKKLRMSTAISTLVLSKSLPSPPRTPSTIADGSM